MGSIASQITSLTIVYSAVYSGADQRKHQSSVSLAFVWGIHRGPGNSPHKWPVTRKTFPFDDGIMQSVQKHSLPHFSINSCYGKASIIPFWVSRVCYRYINKISTYVVIIVLTMLSSLTMSSICQNDRVHGKWTFIFLVLIATNNYLSRYKIKRGRCL